MHDLLFTRTDALAPQDLLTHAEQLGLDLDRFAEDLRAGSHTERIQDDVASAEASGVTSTRRSSSRVCATADTMTPPR